MEPILARPAAFQQASRKRRRWLRRPRTRAMRHAVAYRQRRPLIRALTNHEAAIMWPNRRLIDLFKIEHPILLAPMAGAMDFELAAAVAEGGGLGVAALRHADAGQAARRRSRNSALAPTSRSISISSATPRRCPTTRARRRGASGSSPITRAGDRSGGADPEQQPRAVRRGFCAVVEELKPEVVSFHFGLPEAALLKRVKAAGCLVLGSRHHGRGGASGSSSAAPTR